MTIDKKIEQITKKNNMALEYISYGITRIKNTNTKKKFEELKTKIKKLENLSKKLNEELILISTIENITLKKEKISTNETLTHYKEFSNAIITEFKKLLAEYTTEVNNKPLHKIYSPSTYLSPFTQALAQLETIDYDELITIV